MAKPFFPPGLRSPIVVAVGVLLFFVFLWGAWKFLREAGGDRQVSKSPANTSEVLDDDEPVRQAALI